jgi:hypothetical protein
MERRRSADQEELTKALVPINPMVSTRRRNSKGESRASASSPVPDEAVAPPAKRAKTTADLARDRASARTSSGGRKAALGNFIGGDDSESDSASGNDQVEVGGHAEDSSEDDDDEGEEEDDEEGERFAARSRGKARQQQSAQRSSRRQRATAAAAADDEAESEEGGESELSSSAVASSSSEEEEDSVDDEEDDEDEDEEDDDDDDDDGEMDSIVAAAAAAFAAPAPLSAAELAARCGGSSGGGGGGGGGGVAARSTLDDGLDGVHARGGYFDVADVVVSRGAVRGSSAAGHENGQEAAREVTQATKHSALYAKPKAALAAAQAKHDAQLAPETAGSKWFDMEATPVTSSIRSDLMMLRNRNFIDAKRFYKGSDHKRALPKFFQVGTVIEGTGQFKSGRLTKKERRATFVDELMSDDRLRGYSKKTFLSIQSKKASGGKAWKKKQNNKRKPNWQRK